MLNESQLKEKLQGYSENNFLPPDDKTIGELVPAMLAHVGSVDPVLRDELIYSAFAIWIYRHKALKTEQLREILHVVLDDNHIHFKLGEQNTDSVFTRSFSALLIPLFLDAHRKQAFLSTDELHKIKDKLLYFFQNEKDLRGYVDKKGWAHAIAHASDAIDELSLCSEMSTSDLKEVLETIRFAAGKTIYSYSHLEEERMVTPVISVIDRKVLIEGEIINWIQSFEENVASVDTMPEKQIIQGNVKNFLQSLYFRLRWGQKGNSLILAAENTLVKINPFAKSDDN